MALRVDRFFFMAACKFDFRSLFAFTESFLFPSVHEISLSADVAS